MLLAAPHGSEDTLRQQWHGKKWPHRSQYVLCGFSAAAVVAKPQCQGRVVGGHARRCAPSECTECVPRSGPGVRVANGCSEWGLECVPQFCARSACQFRCPTVLTLRPYTMAMESEGTSTMSLQGSKDPRIGKLAHSFDLADEALSTSDESPGTYPGHPAD